MFLNNKQDGWNLKIKEIEKLTKIHIPWRGSWFGTESSSAAAERVTLFLKQVVCGFSPERLQYGVHEARVAQVAQTDDAHLLGPLGGRLQLLLLVLQNAPDLFTVIAPTARIARILYDVKNTNTKIIRKYYIFAWDWKKCMRNL